MQDIIGAVWCLHAVMLEREYHNKRDYDGDLENLSSESLEVLLDKLQDRERQACPEERVPQYFLSPS